MARRTVAVIEEAGNGGHAYNQPSGRIHDLAHKLQEADAVFHVFECVQHYN